VLESTHASRLILRAGRETGEYPGWLGIQSAVDEQKQ
jgi:hypothetical protein